MSDTTGLRERIANTLHCPTCGVEPGEHCLRARDDNIQPHMTRVQAADAVLPVVEAWAAENFTTERRREPDSLTVYPANEALYGRCPTCGGVRWHTEFHEEGRGAGKRSSHCGCCTHAHDLEPGGHEIARGEAR